MSRIGKKSIPIPQGVEVKIEGPKVFAKGPAGKASMTVRPEINVRQEDSQIIVARTKQTPESGAYWGLTRSLVANMVEGVSNAYRRELEVNGVGYRVAMEGKVLVLSIGFSHPVKYEPEDGVEVSVEKGGRIVVTGVDKQKVSQAAAEIRKIRPPEPYKGKGIKYVTEIVRRKAGKAGKVGA